MQILRGAPTVAVHPKAPPPPPAPPGWAGRNRNSAARTPAPGSKDTSNDSATLQSAPPLTAAGPAEVPGAPLPPPPLRNSRIFLAANTPVFLEPDRTRTPLRVLERGTKLEFLDAEGAWYYVTFEDPQWGTRYGYLEGRFVQPVPPTLELIQRLLEQQRGQQPEDLSVSGTARHTPTERGKTSDR
jgi:hypothetical protein